MSKLLQSYATDWEVETDDAIRCPDCEGRLQRREWRKMDNQPLGTQFRCAPCRIDFWSNDSA